MKSVLEYLERSAEKWPDKTAFADNKKSYTYRELINASKCVGSYVAERIVKGSPVLVYMDKKADDLAAFFGSVYGGGFYVPIDPLMPVDRINLIIETTSPALIIYDEFTKKNIDKLEADCEKVLFSVAADCQVDAEKLEKIQAAVIDTDLVYVLFTSGSTGIPKGVAVCHRSVIAYCNWLLDTFEFNQNTVFGNQTPFYFSMSVLDIYATISSGAALHIIPKMLFSFPIKLLEFLNERMVNTIYWVPSALCFVANIGALECVELPYLKKILFAGEVMPSKQLNIWRKYVRDAVYANLFGPTEITDIGIYYILDREFADDESIPIGRACENVGLILLDSEGNEVKECGKTGELLIRGSFLAMGYYRNPEKTSEVFIQNPLNSAYPETVYKTGDLAYWNEAGELIYVSRKDFQIKHMGNRIELGEIEAALGALDAVTGCCCLYKKCTDEIVAVFTGEAKEADIRAKLGSKLPQYMLPSQYFNLPAMPLNANGKIDRIELGKQYTE